MNYNGMKPVSQMSEDERMQEIASILATGALRYLRQQPPAPQVAIEPKPRQREVWELVDDPVEQQILRYVQQNVSVDPAQMRVFLEISEMTLVRRLAHLRGLGLVRVPGKTRKARDELAPEAARN